jgi:hypothetical protein
MNNDFFTNLQNLGNSFTQNFLSGDFQKTVDTFKSMPGDAQKLMENNIKYQRAFITYNQALLDMMEAINDNIKIMKKS